MSTEQQQDEAATDGAIEVALREAEGSLVAHLAALDQAVDDLADRLESLAREGASSTNAALREVLALLRAQPAGPPPDAGRARRRGGRPGAGGPGRPSGAGRTAPLAEDRP